MADLSTPHADDAFAAETRRVVARRAGLGLGFMLGLAAVAGVLELAYYPDRLGRLAAAFATEAILCVGGGAVTSILGAIFLDLHRRAIFHQRVLLERRRDEQLATLYDVTRTVAATLELQDVLRLVCQSVLHALGVERLWLFWREAPDGALRALAAERRDDQVALTDLPGDPARWEPLLSAGTSRVPALLEPTGED